MRQTKTQPLFSVVMLVRKQCDNPTDYFNKMFVEYQEGFSANGNFKKKKRKQLIFFSGEVWIGLDKLHRLTSERSYSLMITMTDYDGREYVAVYGQFEVNLKQDHQK